VNKVNSKAVLRWRVRTSTRISDAVRSRFLDKFGSRVSDEGFVVLMSDRYRDQGRNVADCLEKLRAMLTEVATPPKKRKKTKPGKGARENRLQKKSRHSEK
jgi:ribosome-associated protein